MSVAFPLILIGACSSISGDKGTLEQGLESMSKSLAKSGGTKSLGGGPNLQASAPDAGSGADSDAAAPAGRQTSCGSKTIYPKGDVVCPNFINCYDGCSQKNNCEQRCLDQSAPDCQQCQNDMGACVQDCVNQSSADCQQCLKGMVTCWDCSLCQSDGTGEACARECPREGAICYVHAPSCPTFWTCLNAMCQKLDPHSNDFDVCATNCIRNDGQGCIDAWNGFYSCLQERGCPNLSCGHNPCGAELINAVWFPPEN